MIQINTGALRIAQKIGPAQAPGKVVGGYAKNQ